MSAIQHPHDGDAVLTLDNLSITYAGQKVDASVLRRVSFAIGRGESFGLVGESGCGKSTLAYSVVRYLAPNARITGGSITVDGADLFGLDDARLRQLRARTVSMVYQDPSRALNPAMRIGPQLAEVFRLGGASRAESLERARSALERVHISRAAEVLRRYPHELSGGMQQRVVIAMALAARPALLILDEPTTALDATVEAEVLGLIAELRTELATAILFITHDLSLVPHVCDRVGVLYAGELVETGAAREVLTSPHHPYTAALLRAAPRGGVAKATRGLSAIPGSLPEPGHQPTGCVFVERCELAGERCSHTSPPLQAVGPGHEAACWFTERVSAGTTEQAIVEQGNMRVDRADVLLQVRGLTKVYNARGSTPALDDVDLDLFEGEILGVVGESGSGKTTMARALVGLTAPTSGSIELRGRSLAGYTAKRSAAQAAAIQVVFQNPDSALNRRHTVGRLLRRAVSRLADVDRADLDQRVVELARSVALPERYLNFRPGKLSGGLKQRVAIARAFAGKPALVICDEPTSALDVSVQATILNLLVRLQREEGVTYLFISHDLGVVQYVADRVAVMYHGRIVEIGPTRQVLTGARHPYTELLTAPPTHAAAVTPDEQVGPTAQAVGPAAAANGCVFSRRCPRHLGPVCDTETPPFALAGNGHRIRCHIPVADLMNFQRTSEAT